MKTERISLVGFPMSTCLWKKGKTCGAESEQEDAGAQGETPLGVEQEILARRMALKGFKIETE